MTTNTIIFISSFMPRKGVLMKHISEDPRQEFLDAIANEFTDFKTTKDLRAFLKQYTTCSDTMPSLNRTEAHVMIERLYPEEIFRKIQKEASYGAIAKRLLAVVEDLISE